MVSRVLLAVILVMTCATLAAASPGEDADSAYRRGDFKQALQLYLPLAEQGDDLSQHALGLMYMKGQGVPQNYTEALKWYFLAAEKGNGLSQQNLGVMYSKGYGVPQDNAEAAKWYWRSAQQGIAEAQFRVGFLYSRGQGLPQDYAEGAKWYLKAAEQGLGNAQLSLGFAYESGRGVPKDLTRAYMWFAAASVMLDDNKAAVIWQDRTYSRLPVTQAGKAQEMAQLCLETHFRNCAREWTPTR